MFIFSKIVDNNDNTQFWLQSELLGDNIFSDDLERDLLPNIFDENNEETNNAEDNEPINSVEGNDTINSSGKDYLVFGQGNNDTINTINSVAGKDLFFGQQGNNIFNSNTDNYLVNGRRGDDTIKGGAGNDLIYGDAGNDRLDGRKGNDSIGGGAGDDTIKGGAGNDLIYGQHGNDSIGGGAGDDTIKGGAGNDTIRGGNGNDILYGGAGNDTLYGGAGDDVIQLGGGKDTLVLGLNNGFDRVLDFKDGQDLIKLNGELSFNDIEIVDSRYNDTIIKNKLTGENLAQLVNVKAETIDINDFDLDLNLDSLEFRSLDGSGNNIENKLLGSTIGQAGNIYRRVGEANYANGDEIDDTLPNARYISNRIFNDLHINLFSENNASHLVFVWGQFLDHTFGLAEADPYKQEDASIEFNIDDPLEDFHSDFDIRVTRSKGEYINGQREQINTVSSFIDGWAIYGGDEARLEWLREGPVDNDLSNNGAKLLLTEDGYLPRADIDVRNGTTVPDMALMSRLRAEPESAIIAGDVRANENTGLTAMHTLFAREHNRIVDLLPHDLNEETKFQIARKVVTAKQQYITYNDYLPSIGIELDPYQGYDSSVDPSLTNEFASVGYRAHSMVHGDFDFDLRNLSDADLAILELQGVLKDGGQIEVPVNAQSGNPSVVNKVGLGPVVEGLFETNYNNDAQIDNQLRSILFEIPIQTGEFTDGPPIERLFKGVVDLGAIDIQRGRDHGMSFYNDMREDFGLPKLGLDPNVNPFYELTGEDPEEIEQFVLDNDLRNPDGTRIMPEDLIFDADDINLNDPSIIDFIAVLDGEGNLEADPEEIDKLLADNKEVEGVTAIQRSTLAARLEAIYKDINNMDAFAGMVAEEHIPGTEFGELQYTIWKEQFEDLRDGDRFFYLNDPGLADIKATFGIDYQSSLGDIIANNTDLEPGDIFKNVFITEAHG